MAKLHYHHEAISNRLIPCTSDHENYPNGYRWRKPKKDATTKK